MIIAVIAVIALPTSSCINPAPLTFTRGPPPPPMSASKMPGAIEHGRKGGEDRHPAHSTQRASFLERRVRAGETQLPFEKYEAARDYARRMSTFSFGRPGETPFSAEAQASNSSSRSGWTSLGPGNIGGRTRSILIDPTNPSIMYAGAVTGGVWKTTDAGKTWNPLTDLLPVLNIGTMAMDPTNSQVVYAGTGESYTRFPGQGIFKTTDGGVTWAQLPSTSGFVYTNKLVMSVRNAQRIYAATSTGVWTSPDGGASWTQSLGSVSNGCQDLALRTDTPSDYLFAACTDGTTPPITQSARQSREQTLRAGPP